MDYDVQNLDEPAGGTDSEQVRKDQAQQASESMRRGFEQRAQRRDEQMQSALDSIRQGPIRSEDEIAALKERLARLEQGPPHDG